MKKLFLLLIPITLLTLCGCSINIDTKPSNNIDDIYNVLSVYSFVMDCEDRGGIIIFPKQEQFVIFTKELFDYHFPKAFTSWWFYQHIQVTTPTETCCEMRWWCYPMWWDWPNEEYNYKHFEEKYWFTIR